MNKIDPKIIWGTRNGDAAAETGVTITAAVAVCVGGEIVGVGEGGAILSVAGCELRTAGARACAAGVAAFGNSATPAAPTFGAANTVEVATAEIAAGVRVGVNVIGVC